MNSYLVSSTKKSSGKTTLTIGLTGLAANLNQNVAVFKKGPDYIDPLWLTQASKTFCYNLDFFSWKIDSSPLHTYYYFKHDNSIIIWKCYNKNEYDIVGVASRSLSPKIKEKDLPASNYKINLLLTSKKNIEELKRLGFYKVESSNTYVIKFNNLTSSKHSIDFQMLDLDIY